MQDLNQETQNLCLDFLHWGSEDDGFNRGLKARINTSSTFKNARKSLEWLIFLGQRLK